MRRDHLFLKGPEFTVLPTPCFCGFLQELILFLQKLPTAEWGEKEVESVLSRAYMWRASFDHARSHLSQ